MELTPLKVNFNNEFFNNKGYNKMLGAPQSIPTMRFGIWHIYKHKHVTTMYSSISLLYIDSVVTDHFLHTNFMAPTGDM